MATLTESLQRTDRYLKESRELLARMWEREATTGACLLRSRAACSDAAELIEQCQQTRIYSRKVRLAAAAVREWVLTTEREIVDRRAGRPETEHEGPEPPPMDNY